jgi:phage FluMu gp28-like protein
MGHRVKQEIPQSEIRNPSGLEVPPGRKPKLPLIPLTVYQRRWVEDDARFKIGRISRQAGKTFSATLEAVLDCHARKTTWVCLSRGERQSKELISQAKIHAKAIGAAVKDIESSFRGTDETEYKMLEIRFPNGSRIIGLPANPDTARGWSANILLDEFALHKDSRAIWRALFPTITRGYKIRIISTPFGKKNKFYELCTEDNAYSKHVVPIAKAIAEGLELKDEDGKPTTLDSLKRAFGDDEGWAQEYEVEFIDEATAFLTYELIATVESDEVEMVPDWLKPVVIDAEKAYKVFQRTKVAPPPLKDYPDMDGDLYLGFDVARKRDLSVIWLDELKNNISWTRAVIEMLKTPFFIQRRVMFWLLGHPKMRRGCIDQTGLGLQIAEEAVDFYGEHRVEGVDFTVANKEALAGGLKKNFEDLQSRIPMSQAIRNSLHSVKKYETSTGHFRFDADRTEETGHADHFWAKALAVQAAGGPAAVIEYKSFGKRMAIGVDNYIQAERRAENY